MAIAPKQIRIVVVDDSAFMRKALSMMLESDPLIKVVGTANNGEDGVERVRQLKPDLVTMDIEMPRMDGLTALRHIMKSNPVPVMMVSSITTDGAQATLEAMELGAVDFIPKQMSYVNLDIVKIKEDLLAKIRNIVGRKHVLMARYRTRSRFAEASGKGRTGKILKAGSRPVPKKNHRVELVAIGSSTGGPPALSQVIPMLPANFPVGVVVAQHMPPMFTKSLADRLNDLSPLTVTEARDGEPIEAGKVLIAPGGKHLSVKKTGARSSVSISSEPSETLYKPCVDVMFHSVARAYGKTTMALVLTGMGSNGLDGARAIKNRGGVLLAQDEATCVVYGMPRAIIEAKLTDQVLAIDNVAAEITSYF